MAKRMCIFPFKHQKGDAILEIFLKLPIWVCCSPIYYFPIFSSIV